MQLAILAFVFGVLLFLMSAATLALEPTPQALGICRLALLLLAILHAAAGFLAVGGISACTDARWGAVATCAAAGIAATVVAALTAFNLAARLQLVLSQGAATIIVIGTLAAGAASVALVASHVRRDAF